MTSQNRTTASQFRQHIDIHPTPIIERGNPNMTIDGERNEWYYNEKYSLINPTNKNVRINIMDVAKHLCLNTNWEALAEEAYNYAIREGERPTKKSTSNSISKHMCAMWQKTDEMRGKYRGVRGTIRISQSKQGCKSARASPSYGITMSVHDKSAYTYRSIFVLFHEIIHCSQLYGYDCHRDKKKRPHDIMFNRMMLKLMQPYFNLTDDQCNVFEQGYKRGNGYAPSRKIERVVQHKFQHGMAGNHAITNFFHLWTRKAQHKLSGRKSKDPERTHAMRYLTDIEKRMENEHGDDWCSDDEYFIKCREYYDSKFPFDQPRMSCFRGITAHIVKKFKAMKVMHLSKLAQPEQDAWFAIMYDCMDEWNTWSYNTSDARYNGLKRLEDYLSRDLTQASQQVKPFSEHIPQPQEPQPVVTYTSWFDAPIEAIVAAIRQAQPSVVLTGHESRLALIRVCDRYRIELS